MQITGRYIIPGEDTNNRFLPGVRNWQRSHVMGGRHNKTDYSKGREALSHNAPHIFREL